MKKIGFIIPYFGKFNCYFQQFLNSCEMNKDCDWLVFTDDRTDYRYPQNVRVYYTTFDNIRQLFQSKFDFPISLERPYKLCDFKPAYGYVFQEYLNGYRFWGHCDTDIIFGNISRFVSESDLEHYDKIGFLGHCTLYRNAQEINTAFMLPLRGKERYREVYADEENHSFDEEFNESINNIFQEHGYCVRWEECEANIYRKSSDFRITTYNFDIGKYEVETKKKAIFIWENGLLKRAVQAKTGIEWKEYMYLHMQARPMRVKAETKASGLAILKIIPNQIEPLMKSFREIDTLEGIRVKYFNLHYFRHRSENLVKKIKRKMKCLYQ